MSGAWAPACEHANLLGPQVLLGCCRPALNYLKPHALAGCSCNKSGSGRIQSALILVAGALFFLEIRCSLKLGRAHFACAVEDSSNVDPDASFSGRVVVKWPVSVASIACRWSVMKVALA